MSRRALPKMTRAIDALFLAGGLVAFAAPSSLGQAGAGTASSMPANTPYVASMTFDVASVRENKDIDTRGFMMSGYFMGRSTTYRAMNWPIESLITEAFGVDRYQIAGAPEWPWPTFL